MKVTYAISIFVFFSHLILNSMEKEYVQGEQNIKIILREPIISLHSNAEKIFIKNTIDYGARLLALLDRVKATTELYNIDRNQLTKQIVSFAMAQPKNNYYFFHDREVRYIDGDTRPRIAALFIYINFYLDQLAQNGKRTPTISEYDLIKNSIKIDLDQLAQNGKQTSTISEYDLIKKNVALYEFRQLVKDSYIIRSYNEAAIERFVTKFYTSYNTSKL